MDIVKLDVPLFIRLLELAREDVKQDADLHDVAEAVIQLSEKGPVTMADYDKIVGFMNKQGGAMGESSAEYDDEAGMADNNLETLKRAVQGIDDVIHTGDNLPEWCQEKIAVAKSMLVTIWDYMKSEEQPNDELARVKQLSGIK